MKFWKYGLFFLCMLCLGACVNSHWINFHYVHGGMASQVPLKIIPVWIDKNYGRADRISINDAIYQWNFALNGYLKLEVQSWDFDMETDVLRKVMNGGGWIILKIDSNSSFTHDDDKNHRLTLGFADRIGGNRIFIVRDRVQNNWMTGLMMHEMGHLLGARHDDHDLMQPVFDWATVRCADRDSVEMVANFQHLPFKELNFCVYGDN